jgi:hypothetical protein
MSLRDYFEHAEGVGVLSTADAKGTVNAAIYARPYFLQDNDDTQISFIMGDRSSHDNILANPSAIYLYIEKGDEYVGKRLTLTKIGEEADQDKIRSICRRKSPYEEAKVRYLVHFRVENERPLIGAE